MDYDSATQYPLCWPDNWPRVQYRLRSRFGERSMSQAFWCLRHEMTLMCVEKWRLSCNIPRNKRDNTPMQVIAQPRDPGVAIFFYFAAKPVQLACDKWDRVQDNCYAIAKHVEALRGQDRWGVGTIEQAFRGYMALPSIGQSGGIKWWDVLGVPINSSPDQVKEAYRVLVKKHHPDVGGDTENFSRLAEAYRIFEMSMPKE